MHHAVLLYIGLPAYSDTGYSDIPATVTFYWSIKGSPFTGIPGYMDIPHTGTLFCRPDTVTVSGEACIWCPLTPRVLTLAGVKGRSVVRPSCSCVNKDLFLGVKVRVVRVFPKQK